MTWLETIDGMADELPTGELTPGVIWWLHGAKAGKSKEPGVFFAKATEFGDTPPPPWEIDNRFEDDAGYSTPELRLAVIGWRSQWFLQDKDDPKALPRYITDYQTGANKHVEILTMVDGLDDPMVISLKGYNKTKAMLDAVRAYENGLLKQASRVARRALPRWTFWLPIKNKLNASGETDYIEAQDGAGKSYGSVVTPPALYLPADAMESCFVGEERMRQGVEIRAQYDDWFKEKRLPQGMVEGVVVKALPPGRNVPQIVAPEKVEAVPVDDRGEEDLLF